jgi:hypothetical protein
MKALGILGVLLIIAGAVVVALQGISYTKDKEEARLGPISIEAEEKGFITPLAGVAALAVGAVLVVVDRQKKRA